MDLVSKLVPLTENLKSTTHFIFEKMEFNLSASFNLNYLIEVIFANPLLETHLSVLQLCAKPRGFAQGISSE